jgi:hypothetical protein
MGNMQPKDLVIPEDILKDQEWLSKYASETVNKIVILIESAPVDKMKSIKDHIHTISYEIDEINKITKDTIEPFDTIGQFAEKLSEWSRLAHNSTENMFASIQNCKEKNILVERKNRLLENQIATSQLKKSGDYTLNSLFFMTDDQVSDVETFVAAVVRTTEETGVAMVNDYKQLASYLALGKKYQLPEYVVTVVEKTEERIRPLTNVSLGVKSTAPKVMSSKIDDKTYTTMLNKYKAIIEDFLTFLVCIITTGNIYKNRRVKKFRDGIAVDVAALKTIAVENPIMTVDHYAARQSKQFNGVSLLPSARLALMTVIDSPNFEELIYQHVRLNK